MAFRVVTDTDIKYIFKKLSPSVLSSLIKSLEQALVEYSCEDGISYQPHRGVVTRPGGQVSLFMPATTQNVIGVKTVGIRPSGNTSTLAPNQRPQPGLKSTLTLSDAQGQAIGILNAAELTAFRTSLGSMLLFRYRACVENIVVFGAGKQALWHIRLAVLLRGQDIRKITIVNRSSARTQGLIDDINQGPEFQLSSHISLTPFEAGSDRDAALEALVVAADALFCTTPATQPLFLSRFLTSKEAREKSRYISAIGSYRLDMQEIDPELLKDTVSSECPAPFPRYKGGVIAVDTVEGCLQEAGELVKAGLGADRLVEVGLILQTKNTTMPPDLNQWLERGFVIYKSVGMGVMDLAIGQDLLRLAESLNVGTRIENF
jgi:ornithine cyclodeaminase/alanine dehydrogenase-like protein (mu-crystallin family)